MRISVSRSSAISWDDDGSNKCKMIVISNKLFNQSRYTDIVYTSVSNVL
jgi:hypothetical protein